ncbi:hypothetical protein LCGC14_1241460 [marine sediment metagenome]|uniref:Uncharacterized protein n=1 Tax=marine sediment metagenome TaxID=412755 RepID=A0A0F9L9N5_9ZZZZ
MRDKPLSEKASIEKDIKTGISTFVYDKKDVALHVKRLKEEMQDKARTFGHGKTISSWSVGLGTINETIDEIFGSFNEEEEEPEEPVILRKYKDRWV